MPFINSRFYLSPTYGRALERARAADALRNQNDSEHDANAHWVTIDHRHILIHESQANSTEHTGQSARGGTPSRPPLNSRQDVVLIPAGSGHPLANLDMLGFWSFSWEPRTLSGDELQISGSKYATAKVALFESVNGGRFKPAGSENGGFRDIISPESRTIVQRFTIDGKRVQVVLGRDKAGRLIKTWEVHVTVRYPNAPVYSPGP